jgi:hypothetical protein
MQRIAATGRANSVDRVAFPGASRRDHSTMREVCVVVGLVVTLQVFTAVV